MVQGNLHYILLYYIIYIHPLYYILTILYYILYIYIIFIHSYGNICFLTCAPSYGWFKYPNWHHPSESFEDPVRIAGYLRMNRVRWENFTQQTDQLVTAMERDSATPGTPGGCRFRWCLNIRWKNSCTTLDGRKAINNEVHHFIIFLNRCRISMDFFHPQYFKTRNGMTISLLPWPLAEDSTAWPRI